MRASRRLAAAAAVISACAVGAGTAAAAPVSTGHSAWAWGSPTPQGQDLAAVRFLGADGYAAGAFGTILHSTDGGLTWSGLPSGTQDDLNLLQEISPTTVVAAGGCSALESTDAGASFEALPLGLAEPCDDPVAGLAFSDAAHGFVELQDGTLFYTDDGGRSLQAKSPPPLGGGQATGLAFNTPTTGIAITSTGLIERTSDGGNSWTQVEAAPQPLLAVTFLDPEIAYALGDGGELLRTGDGGLTWTQLPLAIAGGAGRPNLTSITCADVNNCLITTSDSNELIRTDDGGRTADAVSVTGDALRSVAYTTDASVVGVGDLGATVLSQDTGETFPQISSAGLAGFAATGALTAGLAPGTAYLPGQTGIAATADAGATWSLLRVPTSAAIADVAFPTTGIGYALDRGGVLRRTDDGGTSWRSFPGQHPTTATLLAPSAGTVLLVGPRGVSRSGDGGASFTAVAGRVRVGRRAGAAIASLRLPDATIARGVVVASGPAGIIASVDGGRSWRSVPRPPHRRDEIFSVSAVSPSQLWALGDGRLWSTADGGRRWTALDAIGAVAPARAVSFSSPLDGVIALGTPGAAFAGSPLAQTSVLRTIDGGRTWTPEVIRGDATVPVDALALAQSDVAFAPADPGPPALAAGFFTASDGTAQIRHSSLTISLSRRRTTTRQLARTGHRLIVRGRLSPVLAPDESIAVSYAVGAARWRVAIARVATGGAFQVRLTGIRASTRVVAQALGTSAVAGAGTPVARLRVTR
jgi:photosystem II stability/assembly factor-like uncharacterized protein